MTEEKEVHGTYRHCRLDRQSGGERCPIGVGHDGNVKGMTKKKGMTREEEGHDRKRNV